MPAARVVAWEEEEEEEEEGAVVLPFAARAIPDWALTLPTSTVTATGVVASPFVDPGPVGDCAIADDGAAAAAAASVAAAAAASVAVAFAAAVVANADTGLLLAPTLLPFSPLPARSLPPLTSTTSVMPARDAPAMSPLTLTPMLPPLSIPGLPKAAIFLPLP